MAGGFPSLTKTWHDDTYDAIDPRKRPELSLKGKTVVITGGGTGVGRGLTQGFADAGVATIAILGRREGVLQETKQKVEATTSGVAIAVHPTDITDLANVQETAQRIGNWDVLVSNAGHLPTVEPFLESDPNDWWKAFEV